MFCFNMGNDATQPCSHCKHVITREDVSHAQCFVNLREGEHLCGKIVCGHHPSVSAATLESELIVKPEGDQ